MDRIQNVPLMNSITSSANGEIQKLHFRMLITFKSMMSLQTCDVNIVRRCGPKTEKLFKVTSEALVREQSLLVNSPFVLKGMNLPIDLGIYVVNWSVVPLHYCWLLKTTHITKAVYANEQRTN